MAAVLEQHTEDPEQLQLHSLEQTLRAFCDHVTRLVDDARAREALGTREAGFQLQAFEERRSKALQFLNAEHREPCSIRIGNLEKLFDALDCSREFFATRAPAGGGNEISTHWSVLVS